METSLVHTPGASGDAPRQQGGAAPCWAVAGVTALVVVGWLAVVFLSDALRFVVFNPGGKTGFELFMAIGQMFGALVLVLSPADPDRRRMRWVAAGLFFLGLGALGFGYLLPLMDERLHFNESMYGSLLVRSLSTLLLAIGLVPAGPPRLCDRTMLTLLGAGGIVTILVATLGHRLPRLVHLPDHGNLAFESLGATFPGLTGWHFGLGLVPLVAGLAAAWGAIHRYQGTAFGRWLVVATVLLAGAQLHSMFWPSMYSSVLTTTSVLRLGFTVVIIVGSVLQLRDLSLQRETLLAQEQERIQQLEELGMLKRDFTALIAHEFATPLAAIRNLARMLALPGLSAEEQEKAVSRIEAESRILQLLVRDIQASADVDSADFTVRMMPVSLHTLLDDARNYAHTVRVDYPVTVEMHPDVTVMADPERIGQVIRNLLNNAIRHTPPGTEISVRTVLGDGKARIEVADRGPGIDPAEQALILEKFGRGRDSARKGQGLGLYVSQRILHAHGTDLSIESAPGQGARFSFALRVVRCSVS